MYCILSTLNHSCVPNAMLFKREEVDLDGSVVIFARKNIEEGFFFFFEFFIFKDII